MKIGIMAAMPEEIHTIHDDIHFSDSATHAKRCYHFGHYARHDLILSESRIGKVAAAMTATTLIERFEVDLIIFTGVAGAVATELNIGDIVLADSLYQHDFDGRPIFPQFEIPLTGCSFFSQNKTFLKIAETGIEKFLRNLEKYVQLADLKALQVAKPGIVKGLIATGDQFIQNALTHDNLKLTHKKVLAVEMEGAAVAQVCAESEIPCIILRTISDKANHEATVNFQSFIAKVASHYSSGLVQEILDVLE